MKSADIIARKKSGSPLVMLTAYDYPMARLFDEAGIEFILVGDSLANVVLGLGSTTEVGMTEMLYHTRAVARGAKKAYVIADMPFDAYQSVGADAVANARQLIGAGAQAVKVEWFAHCTEVVRQIVDANIPVIGHIGLTPQTAKELGGFKVQGRGQDAAAKVMEQALALEKAGCFAIVIECVPESLAKDITAALAIPTVGIGAGKYCDGQVLVSHDMLGLYEKSPSFVKKYADLGAVVRQAVSSYKKDVESGLFPGPEQTFR